VLGLEAALQPNEKAGGVKQFAVGLFGVDRHPATPDRGGGGGRKRELNEWAGPDRAAVLGPDREPVEHLVLWCEVEPHARVVSFEGFGIKLHNSQKGERPVPRPDRGLEPGLELRPDLLNAGRKSNFNPVCRCPGGSGVELGPAFDDQCERGKTESVPVEAVCQKDLGSRDAGFVRLEDNLGRTGGLRAGGRGQEHRNEQGDSELFHGAPHKRVVFPSSVTSDRHTRCFYMYLMCQPVVFFKEQFFSANNISYHK